MNLAATRLWPAALAAISGSAMVGVMPLVARQLYADGLDAPSMLFWRYSLALVALAIAAKAVRLDLRQAWRGGAWRIADPVLLGKPQDPRDQHRGLVVLHLPGGDARARPAVFQAADPAARGLVHRGHPRRRRPYYRA